MSSRSNGTESAPPVREDATVVGNDAESGSTWRIRLRVEGIRRFRPGQFAMLSPGPQLEVERWDPLLLRPMAIYRLREQSAGSCDLEVLYKVTGRGTALLATARAGDRVRVVGPLGNGFRAARNGAPALLVGGGTGIASLYAFACAQAERREVRVLLGARSADELMGIQDFRGGGVSLELSTEDGSAGRRGLVTELLEEALADRAGPSSTVYACGPTPMMRRCAEIAARRGCRCVVSLENTMACGFGVCLGCAAPRADGGFELVCRDGPVFDATRIDWEALP